MNPQLGTLLQAELERWQQQAETHSVGASLRLHGTVLWQGCAGPAVPGGTQPLDASGRFLIYSLSKTFTAVCVLKLQEAGKLSLDRPVGEWLPEPELDPRITVRHLLSHTGGLRDYGYLPEYHQAVKARPSHPWSEADFLETGTSHGLLFPPGTGWQYSNVGYMLLRHIVQKTSGTSYRGAVEELIARPLELTQTRVAETAEDLLGLVPGHGAEVSPTEQPVDVRGVYHPDWCAPGVVVSTLAETTWFYHRLLTGGLLEPGSLAQMLELVRVPGHHPPFVTPSYGLGIAGDPDGPLGPSYGHDGGGPGYVLSASILPRHERGPLAVAVFSNSSQASGVTTLAQALLRTVVTAS